MTGKRVVLADDFRPMLNEVTKLLQGSFEIVGTAADGQSALDTALVLNPDLVVLDISMPGMNGIEVAKELKKRDNNAKIVFLTVHEDSNILATCLAVGGLGYVDKLLMHTDLIPALDEALAGRIFVSRYRQTGH
jgi:DNA-binding NarL/FixJ family response regulator